MLSERLINTINEQIQYEMFSQNLYLAMAAYCADQDLPGFTNFFKVQAQEENFHAMKFFGYLIDMSARAKVLQIDEPTNEFDSVPDAFKKALAHEQKVTKRIYNLMDLAIEEREHATISLLKFYVDEQVEEESNFTGLVKRLERISNDNQALYALDAELAARVFTPPVGAGA